MLCIIAFAVDLSQSLSFRPIDVAKLEGVLGSIRKVLEVAIADAVEVEELDYLPAKCCLALGKIGGHDRLGLRWRWLGWRVLHMNDRGGRLDGHRHRWRLLERCDSRWRFFGGTLAGIIAGGLAFGGFL